jgi:hypothetical protein
MDSLNTLSEHGREVVRWAVDNGQVPGARFKDMGAFEMLVWEEAS